MSESKKHVCHVISSLGDGGAEGAMFRLIHADTTATRHEVISLTTMGKYGPLLEQIGVRTVALGMRKGRFSVGGLVAMVRLLRLSQPTTVQTWMYHADLLGGLAAKVAGVKNIAWNIRHSNLNPEGTPRTTVLVAWVCSKLSVWVPTRIVTCAYSARTSHRLFGYDDSKMVVIPNGYDLVQFSGAEERGRELRKRIGVSDAAQLVGCVARYHPLKDHVTLLEAFARLKKMGMTPQLLLVGSGMDESNSALLALSNTLGLDGQLHFMGQEQDIPALMASLDIHVSSSTSEAFPNVIAEAMASGVPCISTDVGDAKEIIDGTGWTVSPHSPEELAIAMQHALSAHRGADWDTRCQECRERISSRYDINEIVKRYNFEIWL